MREGGIESLEAAGRVGFGTVATDRAVGGGISGMFERRPGLHRACFWASPRPCGQEGFQTALQNFGPLDQKSLTSAWDCCIVGPVTLIQGVIPHAALLRGSVSH